MLLFALSWQIKRRLVMAGVSLKEQGYFPSRRFKFFS
jgi:hypothetical protein